MVGVEELEHIIIQNHFARILRIHESLEKIDTSDLERKIKSAPVFTVPLEEQTGVRIHVKEGVRPSAVLGGEEITLRPGDVRASLVLGEISRILIHESDHAKYKGGSILFAEARAENAVLDKWESVLNQEDETARQKAAYAVREYLATVLHNLNDEERYVKYILAPAILWDARRRGIPDEKVERMMLRVEREIFTNNLGRARKRLLEEYMNLLGAK